MQGQMTYKKARKWNAIFLLLLLATDPGSNNSSEDTGPKQRGQGRARPQEFFEEKLKEFERDQIRY